MATYKHRLVVLEYWRSRLFPRDLVYYRRVDSGSGGGVNWALPEVAAPAEFAAILADLKMRYGAPRREIVQGQYGSKSRLIWNTRNRFVIRPAQWQKYSQSVE